MLKTFDAFISYNHKDEKEATFLYDFLTDKGLKVWFDRNNIAAGAFWIDELIEGLNSSRKCIVLCGKEPGPWQNNELRDALRRNTNDQSFKIIPVITLSLHKYRLTSGSRQLARLRGNATTRLGLPDWRTY